MTSKQRANLRSLAQAIEPITQLGKSGITEAFIEGLSLAIEKRELIKISVLENSLISPKLAGEEIAKLLSAECVCVCGRKVVLYKRSSSKGVKHIEF